MGVEENKSVVQKINNGELDLTEYLAEDVVWTIPGYKSFHGKQEVIQELFMPYMNLMESIGRVVIKNIIAEDDQVVVETIAEDRITKKGKPYNNTYCMIYRFADEKIAQITEYSDTAMAKEVLPELVSKLAP
jgi:ketosteroid isomerase-like protein